MTNGKRPDMRVGRIGIFRKGVDGHSGKIRVMVTVDTEVEKYQFLFHNIFGP